MRKGLILLIIGAFIFVSSCGTSVKIEEHDLVGDMGNLQRYSQKLWFSLINQNWELADFYLHEIDEIAEDLVHKQIIYEGNDISNQVKQILVPAIDDLKSDIDKNNGEWVVKKYMTLINSCNTCHQATAHDFINITIPTPESINSFNQEFRP